MGPILLFDKSLLHHLNPEEIEELSMSFMLVSTPTLVREIIADLQQHNPVDFIPEEMVMALARKMGAAHATHPANFRKLALYNLACTKVPMEGQVPIDGDRPNVATMDGGFLYDHTPEQAVWERWANGNFDTKDKDSAAAWRAGTERINLKAVGQEWKEWVNDRLGKPKTIPEIISAVDTLMSTPNIALQHELVQILLTLLRAGTGPQYAPLHILLKHGCLLETIAPYAASVLRLYLVFIAGIAKGRIGPRKTHYLDLQYLFYAPFCMSFASEDHLHETLWPATRGVNQFIKVTALKADLARRIQLHKDGRQTFANGYPIPLEHSVITQAMDHAFRPGWRDRAEQRDRDDDENDLMKPGTRIDDLPPVDRDRIRAAFKRFDEMPKGEADLLEEQP